MHKLQILEMEILLNLERILKYVLMEWILVVQM